MLNLFSKTTSWMVASLLATTVAVSAQDNNKNRPQKSYEQGHEVEKNQLMPAYNAPANISVRGSWDVYATGSFLYWQGREDNLELGIASNGDPLYLGGPFTQDSTAEGAVVGTVYTQGSVANSKFSYGPGFKLGLGVNLDYDSWDAYAEYTWFHKKSTTNYPHGCDCDCDEPSEWLFPTRIMPTTITFGEEAERGYKAAEQKWNLKMDFLDLSLARNYYLGTKLSIRPFFGARGAWIRQSLKTSFGEQATLLPGATTITTESLYTNVQSGNTRSWGVGPRTGFGSNWMLGYGFRLIGDLSGDILYTRYHVQSKGAIKTTYLVTSTPLVTAVGTSQGKLKQEHIDMLRPHADLEMGFGWGSYFDNSNWHVDLLATYGYQVFWDQNMFRMFTDAKSGRSYLPNGNLYVHGLTFTARFDF